MLTTIHWHRFKWTNYKHSVYHNWEFVQRFDSVIQYNAIILSVLLRYIIIVTSCSLVHTAIFECNINNKVNYSSSIVQGNKIH